MIEDKIQNWLIDEIVEVARESTSDGFNEHNATREAETLVEKLVKKLTIPVVVGRSEQLKPMVFELANKLATAGHGNEAVSMHRIHNRL